MFSEAVEIKCKCGVTNSFPYIPEMKVVPKKIRAEVENLELTYALLTLRHNYTKDIPILEKIRERYYKLMGKPEPPDLKGLKCQVCGRKL